MMTSQAIDTEGARLRIITRKERPIRMAKSNKNIEPVNPQPKLSMCQLRTRQIRAALREDWGGEANMNEEGVN